MRCSFNVAVREQPRQELGNNVARGDRSLAAEQFPDCPAPGVARELQSRIFVHPERETEKVTVPLQLNAQQEEVADHGEGRILTLAGPGSGKTKTLTERTGRLIRKGANPASILCLTFTNKARDEMRQRIAAVHGERAAKVFISNFHGLCGIILRRMGRPLGYDERLTVCDEGDQVDLIMQIARKKGMEPTKPQAKTLAFISNDWRENLGDRQDLLKIAEDRCDKAELSVVSAYLDVLRKRNQT